MKRLIKKILHGFNIDIKRIPKHEKNKFIWLKELDIKTVFDIGANVGQFSEEICNNLLVSHIYTFEPIKECYEKLQDRMKSYKNHRSFNFALGEKEDERIIYISEFSPSSSLLKMGDLHKKTFPFTQNTKPEKIILKRLDGIIEELNLPVEDNILIKIDVQGYEDKVIAGGKNTISRAKVVILEVSFKELYEGQPLFESIYAQLVPLGFKYAGNLHILFSPLNGLPLQADAIFIKEI